MTAPARLSVSRRQRSTPYTPRIEALGVSAYSVVNRTILPKGFRKSVEEDYWHLKTHVQLWDVSCQRQIEFHGKDASRLLQWMTPRDLEPMRCGDCYYAPLTDENAGMINDPVILKLADDRYWLSIADSDVLLWGKGLAVGGHFEVDIFEADVWPLAIQGPKSDALMAKVFGEQIRQLKFFKFGHFNFRGCPLLIARSGYSRQGGFEVYLDQPEIGLELWDALWAAGVPLNIAPGSPNLIERVEGGLLSYGNEITRENNPLECGLQRFCSLDSKHDHLGRDALRSIADNGVQRQIRGILFDGPACPPCASTWPVCVDDALAGYITTAIHSPRFNANVALSMMERGFWQPETQVCVRLPDGSERQGQLHKLPF